MPIEASVGTLDVENATLRASGLVATTNLAVGRPALKDPNPPTLEIFSEGVPSLELHSNTQNLANSSNAFARFTASAETLVIQSGTDTANDSKGDIAFSGVNDITRYMTIKGSTGRVGIGTDDPECLLHLSSATGSASIIPTKLKIHTTTQASNDWDILNPWGLIEFDTDDASYAGRGPVAGIGVRTEDIYGGNHSLCFYTDNNDGDDTAIGSANERMCINHDGFVGIGETNPTHPLDVANTANAIGIRLMNPGSNYIVMTNQLGNDQYNPIVEDGDCAIIFSTDANHTSVDNAGFCIAPHTNSTSALGLRVNEDGRVGICQFPSDLADLSVSGPLGGTTRSSRGYYSDYIQFSVPGQSWTDVVNLQQGKFVAATTLWTSDDTGVTYGATGHTITHSDTGSYIPYYIAMNHYNAQFRVNNGYLQYYHNWGSSRWIVFRYTIFNPDVF